MFVAIYLWKWKTPTYRKVVSSSLKLHFRTYSKIDTNHRNILLSIGQEVKTNIRPRRGFGKTISRLANVLYGAASKLNTELIFNKVIEQIQNKQQNTNFIEDNIRIIQTDISEANDTLQHIKQNEQKIERNVLFLQTQIKINAEKINELEIKETLIELALLFEITLNQYAYKTQNLIAIVNLVMQGKIHTSIFPTKRKIAELKEIKMNLPMGEALPLEIRFESLPDFYRIADISILHKDNYLIFNLGIPLIPNEIYYVYHPISLPIPIHNNSIVLIAPVIDHLALSSDSEKFFTLTHDQWEL